VRLHPLAPDVLYRTCSPTSTAATPASTPRADPREPRADGRARGGACTDGSGAGPAIAQRGVGDGNRSRCLGGWWSGSGAGRGAAGGCAGEERDEAVTDHASCC
jgi:hypothetical protein